jgi:hypothetical protein
VSSGTLFSFYKKKSWVMIILVQLIISSPQNFIFIYGEGRVANPSLGLAMSFFRQIS